MRPSLFLILLNYHNATREIIAEHFLVILRCSGEFVKSHAVIASNCYEKEISFQVTHVWLFVSREFLDLSTSAVICHVFHAR